MDVDYVYENTSDDNCPLLGVMVETWTMAIGSSEVGWCGKFRDEFLAALTPGLPEVAAVWRLFGCSGLL